MPLAIECRSTHLLVSGTGLCSLLEAQQHFREVSAALVQERKGRQHICVLVDLREGAPQSQDVSEHIARASDIMFREEDRVAIVVKSTLLKLQVQGIHSRRNSVVFVSVAAAEHFLFEGCVQPSSSKLSS